MHGRILLWNALEEVARNYPELMALDFAWLKRQAQAHHDRADRFRIEAACAVFAESLAPEQPDSGA
jgi:hypothetical protein